MSGPLADRFPVSELDRIWQPPSGGRRLLNSKAAVCLPASGSAGIDARVKLQRLLARAPQVMVKVSGRQQGADHVSAHFAYIGRHGDLDVETEDGETLCDVSALRDRAQEWQAEDGSDRVNAVTSVSMVLSMPSGTDAAKVLAAARAFARVELEGQHRYMLALHNDTDHPHVHLTVAVAPVDADGTRFNPRKADLHRMRETFAHELRERGIEADATPRRARGVTRRTDNVPLRKLKERYTASGGLIDADERARRAGASFVKTGQLAPWERAAVVKQHQVKTAYGRVATILEGLPAEEDRALGQALRAFVDAMPAPLSRRLELAIDQAQGLKREGGDAAAARLGMFQTPGRSRPDAGEKAPDKPRGPKDRG